MKKLNTQDAIANTLEINKGKTATKGMMSQLWRRFADIKNKLLEACLQEVAKAEGNLESESYTNIICLIEAMTSHSFHRVVMAQYFSGKLSLPFHSTFEFNGGRKADLPQKFYQDFAKNYVAYQVSKA